MKVGTLFVALAAVLAATPQWKTSSGATPSEVEALSWQARRDLALGSLQTASQEADTVLHESEAMLHGHALDTEPPLATAVGAAYEVQAQALTLQGKRSDAILLLRNAMKEWAGSSIVTRLQKNLNLLTLTGKSTPALRETQWIGSIRPEPLSALRGKVVLLFFWAHWCPDCKAEAPVLADLAAKFEPKGLVVIAPTQFYGYTPNNEHASAAEEKAFIEKVFDRFYAQIPKVEVPLNSENFQRFGASTTPTLVLIDRHGVIRLYHPGVMDEGSLQAALEALIKS